MKRLVMLCAVLMSCRMFADDWTLTSSTVLTENAQTGNPWELTVKIQNGSEICVTAVKTVGDSTELDFSGPVTDANGTEYSIVEIDGFSGKTTITDVMLPDGLRKLGNNAFRNCTGLASVTPLLPQSLEYFGRWAFAGCTALSGGVVFPQGKEVQTGLTGDGNTWFYKTKISSCDMSETTIKAIPPAAFYECRSLTTVKLPNGIETIDNNAFQGATALVSVEPFLPETVTLLGNRCFYGCSQLESDLIINSPDSVTCRRDYNSAPGVFASCSKIKAVKVYSRLAEYNQLATPRTSVGSLAQGLFHSCTALGSVEFFSDVKEVSQQVFASCSSLSNIVFHGEVPSTFAQNVFYQLQDNKVRFYFDRFNESKASILQTEDFTPMNEALKTTYLAKYPDEICLPLGSVKASARSVWISDIIPGQEKDVVYIESSTDEANVTGDEVSPSYGIFTGFSNGTTKEFSAPERLTTSAGSFKCAGHVLSYETSTGSREFSTPVTNASAVCTITQQGDRVWRLIWLWEITNYACNTGVNDGEAGSVECSPSSGSYEPGTSVTVTAVPNAGCRFVRWTGADVPAGCEYNPTFTLVMDSVKTVNAIFSRQWRYDTSAKTISDGNWVLKVASSTAQADALSVSSVESVVDPTMLDLSQTVVDASQNVYQICEIADSCFKGMEIAVLALGNQIAKIGGLAFCQCTKLEFVDPLLPASLTSLGDGAFYGCESLSGDVVFPENEIGLSTVWNNNNVGWFYNTKITSCDMSKTKTIRTVSGVTCNMIVSSAFYSCKELKRVRLSNEIAQIGNFAFQNATALASVEPFLPESLVSIGQSVFSGCSALEGDLVIGGSQLVTFTNNPNNGDWSAFNSTKIKSARILSPVSNGSARGTFPYFLFNACKSLESVEIGKDTTAIPQKVFQSCTALRDITFMGSLPQFTTDDAFESVTDKKIRFHVSKGDATWKQFSADNVTPMNETLIAEWEAVYPGETRPKGQFTLSSRKMWFCPDFGISGFQIIVR